MLWLSKLYASSQSFSNFYDLIFRITYIIFMMLGYCVLLLGKFSPKIYYQV